MQTTTQNATLENLVQILRTNHARKVDVVAPATAIRAEGGLLVVRDAEAEITMDGVTSTDGRYLPTAVCDDGLASRFDIAPAYMRRMRNRNIELWDRNVNGWLQHDDYAGRNYLVRGFRNDQDGDGVGVGRAFLSDSYKPIDDLDVLMTVLAGIQEAGVEVDIRGCSLTDQRMYVQVVCEQISANALDIVKNYRSPFTGQSGADLPLVFAGLEVSNSEVGQGRFSIAPRVVLQVCKNGATSRADAFEAQHLGQKLSVGRIVWSETTHQKNLELITAKTADAVRTFLSPEYVQRWVSRTAEAAGVPVAKPEDTIRHISTRLRYSEAQQDSILAMFIKGGDLTAGGVMHAVTAAAQGQGADTASDMEADAVKVLELAAAFAVRS